MQQFVTDLLSTGRVRLKSDQAATPDESTAALNVLLQRESEYRVELPGMPPDVDARAAAWGLATMYQLCQFHVYRHLGSDVVEQRFAAALQSDLPGVHYSVDLALRFLPDIAHLTGHSSPEDPLSAVVQRLASDWPLSSVGIPDIAPRDLEPILADDCLRRMYVDRVIDRRDLARCEHPLVQAEIRRVAGAFPDLATGLLIETEEREQAS